MKREALALCLTLTLVFSLVTFAQPTAAVVATMSGPDEVNKNDQMTFSTAVEIREDERIPIDGIDLVISTEDGETVTITLAPDGTVRRVDPPRGVVGEGEIRIHRLSKTIDVTRTGDAGYGYGYLAGEDERTGERHTFGYGYGYGYGYAGVDTTFGFEIELDSRAFKHGVYQLHVVVDTGVRTYSSDTMTVEILLPSGTQSDDGSDDDDRDDRDNDRFDDWRHWFDRNDEDRSDDRDDDRDDRKWSDDRGRDDDDRGDDRKWRLDRHDDGDNDRNDDRKRGRQRGIVRWWTVVTEHR